MGSRKESLPQNFEGILQKHKPWVNGGVYSLGMYYRWVVYALDTVHYNFFTMRELMRRSSHGCINPQATKKKDILLIE